MRLLLAAQLAVAAWTFAAVPAPRALLPATEVEPATAAPPQATAVCADGEVFGLVSHHECRELLELRGRPAGEVAEGLSLDLGRTRRGAVRIVADGIAAPLDRGGGGDAAVATWDELAEVVRRADKRKKKRKSGDGGCYALWHGGEAAPWRVQSESANTGRVASLYARAEGPGAPTMLLDGFTMHRVAASDPSADTAAKLVAARPRGAVLDTCCGLGYTACRSAEAPGVTAVCTIELDDVSIEMCRYSPYSAGLFRGPEDGHAPVTVLRGDAAARVAELPAGFFSTVIHDPPARALCKEGDLYGAAFYADLRRVATSGARLFHYIGAADSKESGRLYAGVMERLREAGWAGVKVDKEALGVVADAGSA